MKIIGITFFLVATCLIAFSQNVRVSGTVSDDKESLIGAFVNVLPDKKGTMTDDKGNYSLLVPLNSKLQFSYTGYETVEVVVKKEGVINVRLQEISKQLTEVVVVGYGTMMKRDVTGAITSIKGDDLIRNEPINLANALQGKVSGLEILTSSEPGSASTYRIRGASTLNEVGSNPLFIVDGMEVDRIDDINPRDIASVEVLKDAASAAIYGSRSANGVVLITTKEGAGNRPKISLSYSLKQTQISRELPQMNRQETIDYNLLVSYYKNAEAPTLTKDTLNPSYIWDHNYQDIMFRKALSNQVDLSVSGAEKKLKYFISAGFLDDQGIQINTFNKRITSRINADYEATNKFKIGNRLSFSLRSDRVAPWGTRDRLLNRPASMAMILPDGTYAPYISSRSNPLAHAMLTVNDNKTYDINFFEFLDYKIAKNLTFRSSIAGTLYQNNHRLFRPSILSLTLRPTSSNTHSTAFRWTHEDVLTYKLWKKGHSLTSMLGFSYQDRRSEYLRLDVADNISEAIETSSSFQTVNMQNTRHSWTNSRTASFFGRVSYSYKGKYLFNSNLRYDGSSRFGQDKRWGLFPSASVGWRFSDEAFMKWSKPLLNDAKLRYSFGKTGNQTAGDFAALSGYSNISYADYVGIYPTRLENNILGWEDTQQHNLGLDFSILKNRIDINLDLYRKSTNNILFNMKLPGTTGFDNSYSNIGGIDNKGYEVSITSKNIRTKDFEWTTALNFAVNRNKLVSIPEEAENIYYNVFMVKSGYKLGTMYGYKALQIFSYDQSNAFTPEWQQLKPVFDQKDRFVKYTLNGEDYTGEVKQMRHASKTGDIFKGGDVMWDDVNKDGVINAEDRQEIGNGQASFVGGLSSDFRYKAFTLSAFFSFSFGGDVYNEYERFRSEHKFSGLTSANPVNVANSWKAPGDIAKYPEPSNARATVDNTRKESSLWIEDGSYIRLRNLKLAYQIPDNLTKRLKVESASLNVMLQNYFTWSNYTGFDPELTSSGFAIGYDNHSYPRSKFIFFGLNVNF